MTRSWPYATHGGVPMAVGLGLPPDVWERGSPLAGRQELRAPHDEHIAVVGLAVGPAHMAAPDPCDPWQWCIQSGPAKEYRHVPIPTPNRVATVFATVPDGLPADIVPSGATGESLATGAMADLARARSVGHDVNQRRDSTRPVILDS
jgi:hypothetical protein